MVSSQIWLNLPRGDHHFGFLKSSQKKTAPSVFFIDEISPKIEISGKKRIKEKIKAILEVCSCQK